MWFRSEPPEMPARKQLRLKCFDYTSGAAYFVTICTYERARLFGQIVSAGAGNAPYLQPEPHSPDQMVGKWLHELENRFPEITLDEWIVMPDHVHFILFQNRISSPTGSCASLQDILKWLKTQTTNEYIRGVKCGMYQPFHKHVWQRGYYEHIIRNDQDLMETRQYILANPIRWLEKQAHK